MASDATLDFEAILAPISEERPAGVELKDDSEASGLYYDIKDARDTARTAERQLIKQHGEEDDVMASPDKPDWRRVRDLAVKILSEKSKDLWVAAWLIEAQLREQGYAGARDAFRVTREICERYWEGIHPEPDEDGYVWTVAQLTGLNGEGGDGALLMPLNDVPITASAVHGSFTGGDYKQAADLGQIADSSVRQKRIDEGALTLEKFETAARNSPPEFFRNLLDDIDQAIEEFDKMTAVLDEKCVSEEGENMAPPSSAIRGELVECRDRIRSISKGVLGSEGAGNGEAEEDGEAAGGALSVAGGGGALGAGRVTTREDAFRALLKVADFFEATEPHSPVAFTVRQAVRWGKMSLPELLAELVRDDSVLSSIRDRTGIPELQQEE